MLYYDGYDWHAYKLEITYPVTVYADSGENYPENATIKEVILTDEMQARLKDIQGVEMQPDEAVKYVIDGVGNILDNRPIIDKLIDKITELDPTGQSLDDLGIIEEIRTYYSLDEYKRNVYIKYGGVIYRTIHPIRPNIDTGTPDTRPDLYARIGGETEDGGVAIEPWSEENARNWVYVVGSKALGDDGKIYEVIAGNGAGINTWPPTGAGAWGWRLVE